MIKSKQFFEADAAPANDNEFMADVNELIKAKAAAPDAAATPSTPEATTPEAPEAPKAAEAQPTTPEATSTTPGVDPAPEEENEFSTEFKAGRTPKDGSALSQSQGTPTTPAPSPTQDKPSTSEDTYKKISSLDISTKKKALVDIVKIVRSNSIKWTTEAAKNQKLMEANSNTPDEENQGLWSKVKKAASDVKSGYENPSGAADELLQKMSPDKTKKVGGGTLTTNTSSPATPNKEVAKTTANAQPATTTPTKSKELDAFIKKSYKTIEKAISKDQKLVEIWKNADDKTKYTIANYNIENALKEFVTQKYDTYWPDPSKPQATPAPTTAPATNALDPQKEEKKKKIIGVLQQDEAGKKMAPKDLDTITQSVADGKTAQQIVDTLRSQNNNQYDVTDDIKHIIGKAIGEANPGQPVEDTSQLKESTKNMIKNCFFMTEADANADAMSNSKEPQPEDVVWYMDSKALKEKIKDAKSIAGKIKFNKIKVELVDVNAEGQQDDTSQEPSQPLKEHLKRMFYEAEDPTQNTNDATPPDENTQDNAKPEDKNDATPPDENTQDNAKPEDKKPNDAKQTDKKSLQLSEGSVMVRYIEGPEKGKEVVAKIKDLELDNSLALDIMQFGYYQADLNGAKGKPILENNLANALINAQKGNPLDAKVDINETNKKKGMPEYIAAENNRFDNAKLKPLIDKNKELRSKIEELNADILAASSKEATGNAIRIQKIDFDRVQKEKICKDVTNNKPLTKDFVLKSKKATKNFIFMPSNQVTRVNYAKGLNWFKMGGFALYILGGQVLKDFSNKLQGLANHFGELSGTKTTSNF